MPARAGEVDREPSRHLASRTRSSSSSSSLTLVAGSGSSASASTRRTSRDAPERSRVDRGRSVELERHSRPLQPWLRAAAAGECAGCGDARRTSCARLRARRLVVRPRRLLVGAEYRRQRPVRHDRRGDGGSPAARARARPRVRHLDGRARERARGRAGRRRSSTARFRRAGSSPARSISTTTSSTRSTRSRSSSCLLPDPSSSISRTRARAPRREPR